MYAQELSDSIFSILNGVPGQADNSHISALNRLQWQVTAKPLQDEPSWIHTPSAAPFITKQHGDVTWSLTYELAALATLSYISAMESQHSIHRFRASLQEELIQDLAPARSNLLLQGVSFYKLGYLDLAQDCFLRAHSQHVTSGVISKFFAYSRSTACSEQRRGFPLSKSIEEFGREKIELNTPLNPAVIITCGNPKYIEKFFNTYVESFAKFKAHQHADLHLHIMSEPGESLDVEKGSMAQILKAASNLLGSKFSYSVSDTPRLLDKRSYFACKRFLILDSFLDKYELVLATDIDFEMTTSIESFLQWMQGYDFSARIAASSSPLSWLPWLKTMAGVVAVRDTELGRSIVKGFREIFVTQFFGMPYNWGIDQNILTQVIDEFSTTAKIGNMAGQKLFTVPLSKK